MTRALPVAAILALSAVTSVAIFRSEPTVESRPPTPEAPAVEVVPAAAEAVVLTVRSQGTVVPRTESVLVAEVPGRVRAVGAGLEPGAFFRAGDLLAQLDDRDLALALRRAEAALLRAEAEAAYARSQYERQLSLRERGIASDVAVDEARRARLTALARHREAEVDVERARRDLERTRIVAPFDGRTRQRDVDVGRFVSVGTPLGRVYAVDSAEIRLPLPDSELAFLDLPLGRELPPERAPRVELSARFAGREQRWAGRIVRTEAEIDPRTRMVHVVARVAEPYAERGDRAPLAVGLFVEAEIRGRRVEDVVRVPRAALDREGGVWIVDEEQRLRRRPVELLRLERDSALVRAGLEGGERIALIDPRRAREGLAVEPLDARSVASREAGGEPAS